MKSGSSTNRDLVLQHYEECWVAKGDVFDFRFGPIHELPEDFSIIEFKPRKSREMWTYATCCMSQPQDSHSIELHMFSPEKSFEVAELLVATAHFHRTGSPLWLGHSVNFGKPWIRRSLCEYGLVSLPYLDGPQFEDLTLPNGRVAKFFWLIPIMKSEVELKKSKGLAALEERFEQSKFNYLDPNRTSVC